MKVLFENGAILSTDSTQQKVISFNGCFSTPIIKDQEGNFYIMLNNKAHYFTPIED